jgi:hypothetical protein
MGTQPSLLDFLEGADLHPPSYDANFSWPDDDPHAEPPATFGLSLVPCQPVATAPDPPAKISLRQHIEGVDAIADAIEQLDAKDLTPEVRDELSAALIGAIAGTKRKVDDTARVLAMFEHLGAAAKAEKDRLAKREAFYARQFERLNDYVLATLEASKLPKIEGETSTLRRQKNPPRLVIAPGTKIADEWLVYPDAPPPQPDKDAIKRAIKAKRVVEGCSLEADYRLVRS